MNKFHPDFLRDMNQQNPELVWTCDLGVDAWCQGEITGSRLLDVGTGSTIHTVISASKHVDEIYVSDFSKPNRDSLQEWRQGTLTRFSKFFEYIVDKEGKSENAIFREEEVRAKVKDVFFVDLLANSWPELSSRKPYDVIVTSLCLEAVAPSIAVYHSIVQRLVGLLKPGGHFVIIGVLGESFYKVGENDFFCLRLSESDVKGVFKSCGLEIMVWDFKKSVCQINESNFKGIFIMVAKYAQKA